MLGEALTQVVRPDRSRFAASGGARIQPTGHLRPGRTPAHRHPGALPEARAARFVRRPTNPAGLHHPHRGAVDPHPVPLPDRPTSSTCSPRRWSRSWRPWWSPLSSPPSGWRRGRSWRTWGTCSRCRGRGETRVLAWKGSGAAPAACAADCGATGGASAGGRARPARRDGTDRGPGRRTPAQTRAARVLRDRGRVQLQRPDVGDAARDRLGRRGRPGGGRRQLR